MMESIVSILRSIERQGSFCAKQTASCEDLQIRIKGFPTHGGVLKLPVSARSARLLTRLARPAKFGLKDQTLLDPEIRDAWEVPKSKVKIDHRTWNRTLTPLLDEFKTRLGLPPDSRLKAHLHNLLVYEAGQFFKPHQDTEKLDGMVATLVVVLPSAYRGGTLKIAHQGDAKRFQAPRSPTGKLTLIAFYADCHHEVTPVTQGYRIALTYNLVLDNSSRNSVSTIPGDGDRERSLADTLDAYFKAPAAINPRPDIRPERPGKWVYLLDHDYTQQSLQWNRLKNADQGRVDALRTAAVQLGLNCYLALADVQEIWDADEEDRGRGYGYQRRFYSEFDDYAEDDDDQAQQNTSKTAGRPNEEYILHDLIDSNITLKHLVDQGRGRMDIDGLHVWHDEICWTRDTNEFDPFDTEYERYMGNYGNTLERWYHRAAIVLWRGEDHYAVLCEVDANRAAGEILVLAGQTSTRSQAKSLVVGILPHWNYHVRSVRDSRLAETAFRLALQIGSAELAQSLLLPLGLTSLTATTAALLADLKKTYGANWCLSLFESWSKAPAHPRHRPGPIAALASIVRPLLDKSDGQCDLADWLLEFKLETLIADHEMRKAMATPVYLKRTVAERTKQIVDLLEACYLAHQMPIHQQTIDYAVSDPVWYPGAVLADILLRSSTTLNREDFFRWGYGQLLDHCMTEFRIRIDKGDRKADDWSVLRSSNCGCKDCREFNAFLKSRTTKEMIWPLNKQRRHHIHGTIDSMDIPVTHTTRREGSPHKLVLTKTAALFARDSKELEDARAMLARLQALV